MKRSTKVLLVFAFVFAIVLSFCAAFFVAGRIYAPASAAGLKADEIMAYLENFFIDEYDEDTLADAAASALIEATGDRWSYYLSAEQYDSYEERMQNAYVGIGVTIAASVENGGIRIEEVTPGGPAEEAGVQVGDVLLRVEGTSVADLGTAGTRELVRGEEGTAVALDFLRNGEEFSLSIVRRSIPTDVALCDMLGGGIGYIQILNFDERCAEETLACIDELLGQGAETLIFDVRFNGGGYKDQLVEILDRLLPEGVLFRSVDFSGEEETDYSDAECLSVPMAVLVNEDTYSAAEFFAAALQEYDAAVVVGMKTSGKGNFQSAFRLSDGSLINISIGKYFTPNGVSLSETGIVPDVEIDCTDEAYAALYEGTLEYAEDVQLQAAIDALREKSS